MLKTMGSRALRGRRGGLTILELLISMTVMVVALAAFSRAVVGSTEHTVSQRETAVVTESARLTLEMLQATTFSEVFQRFNADPNDDPAAGLSPGSTIDVPGLRLVDGDPDGMVGAILFPTATVGGVTQLREDVQDAALGMPRDLNGDGITDALDHAADYRLLPVIVRFEWASPSGPAELEFRTILASY